MCCFSSLTSISWLPETTRSPFGAIAVTLTVSVARRRPLRWILPLPAKVDVGVLVFVLRAERDAHAAALLRGGVGARRSARVLDDQHGEGVAHPVRAPVRGQRLKGLFPVKAFRGGGQRGKG
jgi:hypothetical protein